MKLLLDQHLPLRAASLLQGQNIEAIHVQQIGYEAATDKEIIEYALVHKYVIVTYDADFHTILALSQAILPSVIRIRIQGLQAANVSVLLVDVVNKCEEDLDLGSVVTVQENRIRLKRLPLVQSENAQ